MHSGYQRGSPRDKEVTLIGWLLTEKIVSTKKGEPMEFMTLEGQTGMYDASVSQYLPAVLPSAG